jgi:hypothetical protein
MQSKNLPQQNQVLFFGNLYINDQMSKTLVLIASGSTNRHDFVRALQRAEADEILFVITKENRFCTESGFLKDLERTAKAQNIEITYVSKQSFTRNLISKLGYVTLGKVPTEVLGISQNLSDFLSDKSSDISEPKNISEQEENLIDANPFEKHVIRPTKRYLINRSKLFFLLCFFCLSYVFVFWWFQPHSTIVVKPRISSQSILQNVVIEMSQAEIPGSDEELPRAKGILVRTTIDDSVNISAGGREYEVTNAYGQVTLFNETSEPKFLVPSRLEAAGSVAFRFKKNITIPARTEAGPGKISIAIEADPFDERGKPIGNRGNIIAGTELRFPALRDELQELYYAKANKGPLVGGSTLTRYMVEKEDIDRAKGVLLENFRSRGIEALKKEVSRRAAREDGNQVLLENPALLIAEIKSFIFPNELIGTESQTFEVSAEVEIVGVVIDQASVKKLMLKNLQKVIDDRQMIIALDEDSLEYEILDADNFTEDNWLKLSVKAIGIEQVDTSKDNESVRAWRKELLQPLLGKSPAEARSRLLNDPEIERVTDIIIRPFWQKNIPLDLDKIDLKILLVD